MNNDIEYFKIKLAGLNIEVECNFRYILNLCHKYLAQFATPDIVVRASIEEIIAARDEIPEAQKSIPGVAVCYADDHTEPLILYEKIAKKVIDYNTFLMHGAVIATQGCAYMLTAASGVGKTTRALLWQEEYPNTFFVNGDKPLIKITDTEALACGTPWSGREGLNTNTMVPLRAIFLLERANEGMPDSIEEVSLGKAFPFLLQQTYRPADPDAMRKTIQLLKAMDGKVKFFKFRSHPTAESVRLAYETAKPKNDDA
ncbi:MAG: hypothetical protein IKR85_07790 [Clostridia bacterium]|nr:hypothetical protein [Clostridia bacterium]